MKKEKRITSSAGDEPNLDLLKPSAKETIRRRSQSILQNVSPKAQNKNRVSSRRKSSDIQHFHSLKTKAKHYEFADDENQDSKQDPSLRKERLKRSNSETHISLSRFILIKGGFQNISALLNLNQEYKNKSLPPIPTESVST